MRPTLLARAWINYRDNVVAKDAGDARVEEARQAFYAGAASLWRALTRRDGFEVGEDGDLSFKASIEREISDFAEKPLRARSDPSTTKTT